MLNRRHLRIKVMHSLYAYYQTEEANMAQMEKQLLASVDRIYDLYLQLLLTFVEIKNIAEHRIEENKKKILPTEDDLNPNRRFVDNPVLAKLCESVSLRKKAEERKVNWVGDEQHELMRKIYLNMKDSETFFQHMNSMEVGFEADKQMLIDLFKEDIANFELLFNYFEEQRIDWVDDIDLACSMVLRTIKAIEEDGEVTVLTLHKDEEDELDFVKTLFRKTISMDSENEKLIDELTKNWELERIAKMDVLLLKMGITELQVFKSIPTKVTLNEYIEIAKYYSTPKSNVFINGILDKAIHRLTEEKKIVKLGRGLMN